LVQRQTQDGLNRLVTEDIEMTRKLLVPCFALAAIGLAACGQTPGSRALSGGAIGAGTGAIIGAATGGSAATGALIGGAVTNPNTVNLGHPLVGN
jgi:osmotically inducible lipoprotein OsmB